MTRILVTGASGFIGRRLATLLSESGETVVAQGRGPAPDDGPASVVWLRADLTDDDGLAKDAFGEDAFEGVEAVIHLAGQAHSRLRGDAAARRRLEATNVAAPSLLARRAAAAGVRRFVFVSSATVHGVESGAVPFREGDAPAPVGPYAASKAAAETALHAALAESATALTVVRPPLVYGPGVKGNLARLIAWAARGRPLPSAVLRNRRSLIGLDSLCGFLALATRHPAAAGETFLVADRQPVSTGALFRRICAALDRAPRFLPLPTWLLAAALRPLGRADMLTRLCSNFELDCSKARETLGWQAEAAMEAEVARMVEAWRASAGSAP